MPWPSSASKRTPPAVLMASSSGRGATTVSGKDKPRDPAMRNSVCVSGSSCKPVNTTTQAQMVFY